MEGIQPSWGPEVTGEYSIRQQDGVSNIETGTGWQVGKQAWQQIAKSQLRLPRYPEGR